MNLTPRPRLVDGSILAVVVLSLATGLLSLVAATADEGWVFVLHGILGFVLLGLLYFKLRRVAHRVTRRTWTRETVVSVATVVLAFAALGTGIAWVFGANVRIALWNLMNVHVLFGLLTGIVLAVHLAAKFRLPTTDDLEGRRTAIQYVAIAAVGAGAWGAQQLLNSLLATEGADRRFTGSNEQGSFSNAFPVTSWMADDPDPVDPASWTLAVDGAVDRPLQLDYDEVAAHEDTLRATLDCTSGWYTRQDWSGVRIGRLLERADATDGAGYVSFHSVTGYRWTIPREETAEMLLATRVDGRRLSHGHGFPMRLVAPGRRGFQWVKWVERVEVREDPDPGAWAAIFTSWI